MAVISKPWRDVLELTNLTTIFVVLPFSYVEGAIIENAALPVFKA
jgi:hypothetical protein